MVETETIEVDGLYLHRDGNAFTANAAAVDENDIYISSFSDNGKLLFCSSQGEVIAYQYDDIISGKAKVEIPEGMVIDNYFALPTNVLLVAHYKKDNASYIKLLSSNSIVNKLEMNIQDRIQYYILPLGLEQEYCNTLLSKDNNGCEFPISDIEDSDINLMVSYGINI